MATSASAPRDIGAAFDLRDRNVGLLRGHLAAGLRQLRAGLIDGHLEIARIEIHQRIARFHDLVVVHINLRDGAVDARADGVQVSFHLGVVGGFELARLEPKVKADTGGNQQDQEEDDEMRVPRPRVTGGSGLLSAPGWQAAGAGVGDWWSSVLMG